MDVASFVIYYITLMFMQCVNALQFVVIGSPKLLPSDRCITFIQNGPQRAVHSLTTCTWSCDHFAYHNEDMRHLAAATSPAWLARERFPV
jgi:hypothetical protein